MYKKSPIIIIIFNIFLKIWWYFIFLGKHMCEWGGVEIFFYLWITRGGWKFFCVHQLLEQTLHQHFSVYNYSDKNEVLFPVLGIIPLHRSMLFLLRNVIWAVKYDRRKDSMLRVFSTWNRKTWLKTSESKNIFKYNC